MPRKQTKHETQENIYKIYGLLLFSILSDFDLIVVFNALYIFFSCSRSGGRATRQHHSPPTQVVVTAFVRLTSWSQKSSHALSTPRFYFFPSDRVRYKYCCSFCGALIQLSLINYYAVCFFFGSPADTSMEQNENHNWAYILARRTTNRTRNAKFCSIEKWNLKLKVGEVRSLSRADNGNFIQ